MNPDDAFERCLESLHEAALDDACGVAGNSLAVGEAIEGKAFIYFAYLLYRGESRQDQAREYVDVHYPHDAGMRRLMDRPQGWLVHLPDLFTEEERRTSPVYNEAWSRLGGQDGLSAHFRDPDGLRLVWSIGDPVGDG